MNTRHVTLAGRLATALIASCACAASTGCGNLEQPALAKAYFAIDPGRPSTGPATPEAPPQRPILTVEPIHVSAPYDGVWLVYKTGPLQFDFDRYNVFFAPPESLLTGSLIGWLNRTGPLSAVADSSSLRSDLMLEGNVTALYIDSTSPGARKAVIAGRFFLIRQRGTQANLVAEIPFDQSADVTLQTPAGFADALSRAWRQVLGRLADALAK